ncbi:MAG: efflux RND transporter periplasmic adaptor subunit [Deltaproteobacteria bacterium]|jgi:membrane fusion protein (multidrug efflux system)|nr:efflux RND transporter periplasmic adaptor subunit [Deltaproteobacteria bacterium]
MSDRPTNPAPVSGEAPPQGRRLKPIVKAIFVVLGLGLVAFAYWLIFLRPLETTDDAYVNGRQIRVTPRTSGTILEILVDNTDDVLAGQLLVVLDPADATLAVEEARENLANAVRQVASLNAQRDRLVALIEARQNELLMIKNDYERRLKLKAGTSVTAEEVERYRNQTDVARANLKAARSELRSSQHILGSRPLREHPQVRAAASKLKEAWLALKRCEIRSPATGRVARRTAQVGSLVAAGAPLMLVTPLDEIWVDANFKESQLKNVKPGLQVRVKADVYGGSVVHRGVVAGRSAGTGSAFSLLPPENATGNWIKVVQRVPVRILLDPKSVAEFPLLLGLSCRVEALLTEPTVDLPPFAAESRAEAVEADFTEIDQEIEAMVTLNLAESDDLWQGRLNPDLAESPL